MVRKPIAKWRSVDIVTAHCAARTAPDEPPGPISVTTCPGGAGIVCIDCVGPIQGTASSLDKLVSKCSWTCVRVLLTNEETGQRGLVFERAILCIYLYGGLRVVAVLIIVVGSGRRRIERQP